jgi:hypothetical protein
MVRVSADQFTKKQLGIKEEITDSEAKRVCEQLSNNENFRVGLSNDMLVIQRFLRD